MWIGPFIAGKSWCCIACAGVGASWVWRASKSWTSGSVSTQHCNGFRLHICNKAASRIEWLTDINVKQRVVPYGQHQISSSSDSSEILIFSMADLIKLESELLGFKSKAVLKCLSASLCCSSFLKILPIWNHTLASFGAISCTAMHDYSAVAGPEWHCKNGMQCSLWKHNCSCQQGMPCYVYVTWKLFLDFNFFLFYKLPPSFS